jgi:hypothetical protein
MFCLRGFEARCGLGSGRETWDQLDRARVIRNYVAAHDG